MSTATSVIKASMETCEIVINAYLEDLTDENLFLRPTERANHIAWQLGHLISSENQMMSGAGFEMPALPDGFAEAYTTETTSSDDPAKFHTKAQYLTWMQEQRNATLQALDRMSDADLDKPGPESMRDYAPTVGAVLNLIGMHELMHSGQFVPVRRKLGKPVTI